MTRSSVVGNNEQSLPPVEEIAHAIVELSAAARKMMSTRLKTRAIVILLQAMSGAVKRSDIEIILNNLQFMDREWLKPLTEKEKTNEQRPN